MSHMLNYSATLPWFVTAAKQLLDARNVYELGVTVRRRNHDPNGQSSHIPILLFSSPALLGLNHVACVQGTIIGFADQAAAFTTGRS